MHATEMCRRFGLVLRGWKCYFQSGLAVTYLNHYLHTTVDLLTTAADQVLMVSPIIPFIYLAAVHIIYKLMSVNGTNKGQVKNKWQSVDGNKLSFWRCATRPVLNESRGGGGGGIDCFPSRHNALLCNADGQVGFLSFPSASIPKLVSLLAWKARSAWVGPEQKLCFEYERQTYLRARAQKTASIPKILRAPRIIPLHPSEANFNKLESAAGKSF